MTPDLEAAVDADPGVVKAAVALAKAHNEAIAAVRRERLDAFLAARKAAAERLAPKPVTVREMAEAVLDRSNYKPETELAKAAIAYFDKAEKELASLRKHGPCGTCHDARQEIAAELLALKKLVVAVTDSWGPDELHPVAQSLYDAAQRLKAAGVKP